MKMLFKLKFPLFTAAKEVEGVNEVSVTQYEQICAPAGSTFRVEYICSDPESNPRGDQIHIKGLFEDEVYWRARLSLNAFYLIAAPADYAAQNKDSKEKSKEAEK